jgi:hypothetical protein
VPELHLQPQAEKDIRRLGEDASNLDIKAIVGSPGWRRLTHRHLSPLLPLGAHRLQQRGVDHRLCHRTNRASR